MSIGEEIKEAALFRSDTENKVRSAFKAAIDDAKKNGIEVEDTDLRGDIFKACFNGYEVEISVMKVVNNMKINNKVLNVTDEGIVNTVNRFILEQINF